MYTAWDRLSVLLEFTCVYIVSINQSRFNLIVLHTISSQMYTHKIKRTDLPVLYCQNFNKNIKGNWLVMVTVMVTVTVIGCGNGKW